VKERAIDSERTVVAHSKASEVAEPSNGALDHLTPLVATQFSAVLCGWPNAILLVWADQLDPAQPQAIPQRIAVIGLVGDDPHRLLPRTARAMPSAYTDRRQRCLREPDDDLTDLAFSRAERTRWRERFTGPQRESPHRWCG